MRLSKKTFKSAMGLLSTSGLEIDSDKMNSLWLLLEDLPEENFKKAVVDLCREVPKFWAGDNIPGMIRERIKIYKDDTERMVRIEAKAKQIEQWAKDAAPMPKEFMKTLAPYKIPIMEVKDEDY